MANMERWKDYEAGKLTLPAVVQKDASGVLIATESGLVGPFEELEERKGWTARQYAELAAQVAQAAPLVVAIEMVEEDYRAKYESLKAEVAAIDLNATKTVIVSQLRAIRASVLGSETKEVSL